MELIDQNINSSAESSENDHNKKRFLQEILGNYKLIEHLDNLCNKTQAIKS